MRNGAWEAIDRHRRAYPAAPRAARPGRMLAAGRDRIRALPPPLSAWTASRDAPKPPTETFRDWWVRTRGGAGGTA